MAIAMRCRCGQVKGEVATDQTYARATCYCRDCQAYVRWLGASDVLDAQGGTDIVAMAPAGVRFTHGIDQMACMSLSDTGLLRWYAACCRTPLGNTPRNPKLAYVGMVGNCFDAIPDAVDQAFGVEGRIALNPDSATGPVRRTPLRMALGGLRIVLNLFAARLRGQRASPFFDAATGQPIRAAEVA